MNLNSRYFIIALIAIVVPTIAFVSARGAADRGYESEIQAYITQGLAPYVASARLANKSKVSLLQKYPNVTNVIFQSSGDLRLEGMAIAYLSLLGKLTRTRFATPKMDETKLDNLMEGIIIVVDDSIQSWSDLSRKLNDIPGHEFFKAAYDTAIRRELELGDCAHVPIYTNGYIGGGIIYFRPMRGVSAGNLCMYQSLFAILGFSVPLDDSKIKGSAALLDIKIINALYNLEGSQLNTDSAIESVYHMLK